MASNRSATEPFLRTQTPQSQYEHKIQKTEAAIRKVHMEREQNSKNLNFDVQISHVDFRTKNKILEWLIDIRLIKENAVSVPEFPPYCRNGVLFSDLINRLEGVSFFLVNLSFYLFRNILF